MQTKPVCCLNDGGLLGTPSLYLTFDQYIYIQDCLKLKPEYKEKSRKFIKLVDDSLKKFARYNLSMEQLGLTLPLFDLNCSSLVDQWVALSLDSGVRELSLSIERQCIPDDSYALHESTFVAKSMSGSSKLVRLQRLSLFGVWISETAIQDIVRHCPNLDHLVLHNLASIWLPATIWKNYIYIVAASPMTYCICISLDFPSSKFLNLITARCCERLRFLHNDLGIFDSFLFNPRLRGFKLMLQPYHLLNTWIMICLYYFQRMFHVSWILI